MIIETSSGQTFVVWDDPAYDHAWMGRAVKRAPGGYAFKAKSPPVLVRKAATRAVAMDTALECAARES